jgi:hypothetical protein
MKTLNKITVLAIRYLQGCLVLFPLRFIAGPLCAINSLLMKNLLLILLIALSACSNDIQFEGTYKHKSCKYALTCEYFDFFNDSTFTYNKILHTSQHKSFNGSWTINKDTVHLKPYGYVFPDSSNVVLNNDNETSKTNISINMIGGFERGQKPDTTKVQWYVSIDGGIKYKGTDTKGNLYIKKQYINEIRIKDIMQHAGQNKLFRNKDSIFIINAEADEINIFLALKERQPEELKYMPKKLYWKGNKLFPVYNHFPERGNYYKRSKSVSSEK